MGRWYKNQGWNRNLLVQLSGEVPNYQLDVYVVARFRFFYAEGAENWNLRECREWRRRFTALAYNTWSEKWNLLSDISCAPVDVDRLSVRVPTARVRVHAVDVEAPSVPLPPSQRIYAVNVYRRAPGDSPNRDNADALPASSATTADAARSELPAGTSVAEVNEDSLELRPPTIDDNRLIVAMHEFGHMLGLVHPNSTLRVCLRNPGDPICYGQAYSPESSSIMGRGQEIRREDYRVFVHIISRLVPTVSSGGPFDGRHRLFWAAEGTSSVWCDGQYGRSAQLDFGSHDTLGGARSPGSLGSRGALARARPRGPLGMRDALARARPHGTPRGHA